MKYKNFLRELSDEDYNKVCMILGERIRNVVFMAADKRAKKLLDEIKKYKSFEADEQITITYNVNFLLNDIVEIVGGIKHEN